MIPTVLLLDILVLLLTYNITYENVVRMSENQLRNAAKLTVQYCESYDLYENMHSKSLSDEYDEICESFDITYIYIVDLDLEKNTETYLAIGFGENASQEAKDTRYPGVTVEGMINAAEIKTYSGDEDGEILHERNRLDDSLVYYMPVTRHFNTVTLSYDYYDHPLILGTEISLDDIVDYFQKQFTKIAILTVALSLLMILAFGLILYFKVSKPARRISERMSSYITDREKGVEKLEVKGNDEFAMMSRAFNTMTDDIDSYLNDIDALTLEKHTQAAELNIARNIQKGLLRPEHFDSPGVVIDAYMLPAKDVGGDLYDYQVMDDGRVFAVVADVSGKGISASLFMARAITLLHQFMQSETSPAKILSLYNDTLAEQNPGGLFITTFLAVWDPMTGELTYSNAGHNFPYILSQSLITLDGAHGVAAGLFSGEEYEDATAPFTPGDVLFLYTDGVNEAKDAHGAFYSTERLEKKLTEFSETDKTDTMNKLLSDLNGFTRGATQSDDITMLALQSKPKPDSTVLRLISEPERLEQIKEAIFALDVGDDLKHTLHLAAEEIFVNICYYAYDSPSEVELTITPEYNGAAMTFVDGGRQFDPTADLLDINEYDHERAIGGLGRFLTFSLAERYSYEYRDGKNILYLFFCEVKSDDNNKSS